MSTYEQQMSIGWHRLHALAPATSLASYWHRRQANGAYTQALGWHGGMWCMWSCLGRGKGKIRPGWGVQRRLHKGSRHHAACNSHRGPHHVPNLHMQLAQIRRANDEVRLASIEEQQRPNAPPFIETSASLRVAWMQWQAHQTAARAEMGAGL